VTKDIYRVYIDAGMDEVSKIWTGVRQVLDISYETGNNSNQKM
jgi:hypothetical protein